jgi:hypothetical protein
MTQLSMTKFSIALAALCILGAPLVASAQGTPDVTFGSNGPVANIPAQAAQASNVGTVNSLGTAGVTGRTSYRTGEAPNSAGMSGLSTQVSTQNYPITGAGTNFGPNMTGAVNGLMAPMSVSNTPVRAWYGNQSLGFPTNVSTQRYTMSTGLNRVIDNLTAPALPHTGTSSVDANVTLGGGW